MSDIINIQSLETWPPEILDFLEHNQEIFTGWQCRCCNAKYTPEYDRVIYQFRDILRKYSLIGYHCTKLISSEIDEIRQNGMSLQDLNTLSKRIDDLYEMGFISEEIKVELKTRNQANEEHRARMLWFCFFEPHIAGEPGISSFFDSWGGEALYNSHDDDSKAGSVLKNIGTPCIVKARVPMHKLTDSYLPDTNIFRAFLKSKGHKLENPIEHEAFSVEDIPSENIIDIIEYPNQRFKQLTKCEEWHCKID